MKRMMLCGLLAAAPVAWSAGAASAVPVTVYFDPAVKVVTLGDTFTVDLLADIPDPVVGWGLDFAIADSAIAAQTGPPVVLAPWTPAGGGDGDGLAGLVFAGGVTGVGVPLATIALQATMIGTTDLLASFTLADANEGFALDDFGFAEVVFEPGFVEVVPEPHTLALVVLGGLGVWVRRRA